MLLRVMAMFVMGQSWTAWMYRRKLRTEHVYNGKLSWEYDDDLSLIHI